MLYFILPDFINFSSINSLLFEYNKSHAAHFKEKVEFIAGTGGFPYSSWNGGINTCFGDGILRNDIERIMSTNALSLKIDFSNLLLEDYDLNDVYNNLIFDTCDTGSNYIEIANLSFFDNLKEKYPNNNYKFVLSKNINNIMEMTPELYNDIIDSDNFSLIDIPIEFNENIEFLKQINRRNKLCITIGSICPIDCPYLKQCALNENELQLKYSCQSNFTSCQKLSKQLDPSKRFNFYSLQEIKEKFVPLGINNFMFAPITFNANQLLHFYINYFIKEEYQFQAFSDFIFKMSQEGQMQ